MRFNLTGLSMSCALGLLLLLNALCMLIALSTLGFAIVDMRVLQHYGSEYASGSFIGDVIIIVACLVLLAVAIFGCIGALRGNLKILYLYVGLLLIMIILEFLIGIFVGVQRYGLEIKITDWMREDFYKNFTGQELSIHNAVWEDLQYNYECCGLNGPEDYAAIQRPISMACCPRAHRTRSEPAQMQLFKACVMSGSYYTDGCENEVLFTLRSDADYLLGVVVICFWFEVAGMVLAMWIANSLKNSVKVYKHTVKY